MSASLTELSRDRIVLVIVHDFANLAAFARVVFLDNGRVAGDGRHDELLASSQAYAEVTRSSSRSEG